MHTFDYSRVCGKNNLKNADKMIPANCRWKKVKRSGQYYRNVRKEFKELMSVVTPPLQMGRSRPNQISSTIKDDTATFLDATGTSISVTHNTSPVLAIEFASDASQVSNTLPNSSSQSMHSPHQPSDYSLGVYMIIFMMYE